MCRRLKYSGHVRLDCSSFDEADADDVERGRAATTAAEMVGRATRVEEMIGLSIERWADMVVVASRMGV